MRSWHQPMRGNVKLLGQTRGKEVHENSRERSSCYENEWAKWVRRSKKKNPLKKAKRKVRHFCFIKSICLRFLWARLFIGFGTNWPLFMTVSWRLLLLNVLGNVTDSLILCNAAGPPGMSTLCWKLYYTFNSLVLAILKKFSPNLAFYFILFHIFSSTN